MENSAIRYIKNQEEFDAAYKEMLRLCVYDKDSKEFETSEILRVLVENYMDRVIPWLSDIKTAVSKLKAKLSEVEKERDLWRDRVIAQSK